MFGRHDVDGCDSIGIDSIAVVGFCLPHGEHFYPR